ncbi:HNH endonuclease, partial [Gordonia alkanivorans]|nr:HNH endonuclease [Gordonia alkanivorans]
MTVLTEISQTDGTPSARAAELVQELHRLTTELQAVDLAQCSDAELIDVAAGTERAIARLTFAGDR